MIANCKSSSSPSGIAVKSIADPFRHALRAGYTIEEIFQLMQCDL